MPQFLQPLFAQPPGGPPPTTVLLLIFVGLAFLAGMVFLAIFAHYFSFWVQSVTTGAGIGIGDLIGMTLRKVNAGVIVRSKIMAVEEEDLVKWDFAKPKPRDEAIQAGMQNRKSGGGGAADPSAIGHHGHAKQFQNVLQAIKKGVKPAIDGPEGRRATEIILAIYKSAETGRAVELPLKSDPTLAARKK